MAYDIEQYLNVRSASGPSFSPDGGRIAFLCNMTGVALPWVAPLGGGWPQPLSLSGERSGLAAFSPAGDLVAFDRDQGGNEHWQIMVCNGDGGDLRRYTFDPAVSHEFGQWSPAGDSFSYSANAVQRRRFDVYVQPVEGSAPRLVYSGQESAHPAAWTPDGKRLVVMQGERPDTADLYLVDVETGEASHLTPHEGDAAYYPAGFSADGRKLYLRTDQGQGVPGPGDPRPGQPAPGLAAGLRLGRGKRGPVSRPWDAGIFTERRWRFANHAARPGFVPGTQHNGLSPGVVSGLTWAPGGGKFAFTLDSSLATSDVWTYDVERGLLEQVTHSPRAGLGPDALAAPQVVRFPALDGLEIPALLYAPKGAAPDGSRPAIVQVHGGPAAQTRQGFDPVLQYFANRGYVVLAVNVRGSVGYGRTYSHLDDVRQRMDSVADLEAANRWLRSSGWAHPERIAVMGPSYGGFMVLSALTTYPESWAAGVNERGVADFVMHLERTEPQNRPLREMEYGTIERDGDFLRSISPIHHVDKIRVPLVVVHGANDPRVSVSVAEALVAQLREYNVPVEYLRFEDEGHGLWRLANRLRAYPRHRGLSGQTFIGATSMNGKVESVNRSAAHTLVKPGQEKSGCWSGWGWKATPTPAKRSSTGRGCPGTRTNPTCARCI